MRARDLGKYADMPNYRFADAEAFIESGISSGVLSITHNKAPIDFLAEFRGSPATLVAFNSALTSRQTTLPFFSARATARAAGLNLIAVSDPSVALGVDLAWYLGSRGQGRIRPTISRIINHLLDSFGSSRTILFGSSGGGYAAAYYAPDFPGSVALILNPRLDLSAPPRAAVSAYIGACHKTQKASPRRIRADFVPERVADTYPDRLEHYVAIIQNLGDTVFLTHQTLPFADEMAHTGHVYVQYGDWGEGHIPVPKQVVSDAVSLLGDTASPLPDIFNGSQFQPAGAVTVA